MKNLLFSLFLLFRLSAFSQQYEIKTNIPYNPKTNDGYITERCVLDIYYPKETKGFATIVWFHGGGLTGGEKFIPEQLKGKGFCVVSVNYRLSPKVKGRQCIGDAAMAMAWVFKNISTYGGDASRIFVSGHSAGAYLGLMIGLDKNWLKAQDIDADKIAGLIPFSGQCITHFLIRKENGIDEKQPTIDAFAPLFHVRADAPPLLLITGDRELEMLGRYEENAYLMRMMKIAGHKQTKLYELNGYGHDMAEPAYPILIDEVRRIIQERQK
jgi:acetyl esterase/lipase